MTNTEVQKFDPATLMQGVKDRIKATFVSLIPDNQWEELCQKEIDSFFLERDNSWSSQRQWGKMSDFQKICFEEFESITKEKIKEMLKNYTSDRWNNNAPQMNDNLKKLIEENADTIFASMLGSMMQSVVNSMQQR